MIVLTFLAVVFVFVAAIASTAFRWGYAVLAEVFLAAATRLSALLAELFSALPALDDARITQA